MIWRYLARPILFRLPAEPIHQLSMTVFNGGMFPPLSWLTRRYMTVGDSRLKSTVMGLAFDNPVGLAAGFDKDARWFSQLKCLGFGHIEVGTITGEGQPGNPRPRLFRLPQDQALINRLGFNNRGSDWVSRRLASSKRNSAPCVLGVNIGKSKKVPVDQATRDYLFSFERLFAYGDYFVLNVSSPNTPGLRSLQYRQPLIELLAAIIDLNGRLAEDHEVQKKPVLLKISPDLSDEQLKEVVEIASDLKIDGIIATNTTLSRDNLRTPSPQVKTIGDGGLSGAPLTLRSRQMVATIYSLVNGQIPIIGVGGIMSGPDAWKMIQVGASLVQIYTGFVYGGPAIVRQINQYLVTKLEQQGLTSIGQAVGRQTE